MKLWSLIWQAEWKRRQAFAMIADRTPRQELPLSNPLPRPPSTSSQLKLTETWCFAVDPLRADGRFGPTDCQTNRPSEGTYRGGLPRISWRMAVQGVEQMNEQAGFFSRIGRLFKGGSKATAELPELNMEERAPGRRGQGSGRPAVRA